MSRWLSVEVLGDIADNGLDDADRQRFGFNVVITAAGVSDAYPFDEEIATLLIASSAATAWGTDLFGRSKQNLPTGDGPYVSIMLTGGPSPLRTHNEGRAGRVAYRRLTAQIVARAASSTAAYTTAAAAFTALAPVRNTTVAPTSP